MRIQDGIVRGLIILLWLALIAFFLMFSRTKFMVKERSITVFSWGETFSRERTREFEKATGIKVYYSAYETNEELMVKLRATKGAGYDLIVPSDYAVKKMIAEGLLKKIDKTKLNFIKDINPLLMGHFFDPSNDYSLPFEWEIYTVGINKNYIDPATMNPKNAWDLVFKQWSLQHKITMVNDSVEAIIFAAYYLFGPVDSLSDDQALQVMELLKKQKSWIEAYNGVRIDYYLRTDNTTAGISQSSAVWRGVRSNSNIGYVIPEKTFITIENCALPVATEKEDLVYEYLNFFYTKESLVKHYNEFLFCPVRIDVIDDLDVGEQQKKIMRSSVEAFENYSFVKDIVSEEQKHEIWISAKS